MPCLSHSAMADKGTAGLEEGGDSTVLHRPNVHFEFCTV